MNTKNVNLPKKGAARKWAQKLKDLRKQKPPKDLVDAINQKERKDRDRAASSLPPDRELEI